MISPPVITSKIASKDFENIKAQHAELVRGIADQGIKVASYNQQKSADLQAQQTMKMQADKEKSVADTQAQKDAMTFSQKQAEIDIKRAALSSI